MTAEIVEHAPAAGLGRLLGSLDVVARNTVSGWALSSGHFGHLPNPDSVVWLLRHVMPLVWETDPSLRCSIVGHGWNDTHLPRRNERIEIIGPVPDLRDVFNRVRLTAAPLRFGAGIKGKVLESFVAGIPCVMSAIGAEGLTLTPPLTELVAETARPMADAILRFHSDEAANLPAGKAGIEMIERDCSERAVRQAMALVFPSARTETAAPAPHHT